MHPTDRENIQQHVSLTCASRYAMRTGRHYASIDVSTIHDSYDPELRVGVVRPLGVFGPAFGNYFSPYCPQRQERLRSLAGEGVDACTYRLKSGTGRWVDWSNSDPRGSDDTGQVGRLFEWRGMEAFDTVSFSFAFLSSWVFLLLVY